MPSEESSSIQKSLTFDEHANGSESSKEGQALRRTDSQVNYAHKFWKFRLRDDDDDEDV